MMGKRWRDGLEQAVLGTLLCDNERLFDLPPGLMPKDFGLEAHGVIYALIIELVEQRKVASPVTVHNRLRNSRRRPPDGESWATYLAKLAGLPAGSDRKTFAPIAREVHRFIQTLQ